MSDADPVTAPWEPNPPAPPVADPVPDPWGTNPPSPPVADPLATPWGSDPPNRPDAPSGSYAASWPDTGQMPLPTGVPEMPTHGNAESGDYWVEVDPRSFDD